MYIYLLQQNELVNCSKSGFCFEVHIYDNKNVPVLKTKFYKKNIEYNQKLI